MEKITWKQNLMHPSDVSINVKFASKKEIKFLLKEDMVNHIHQKRDEKIEIHFYFNESNQTVIHPVDFSKLKPVKPVYPLLQQNMVLPKIKKKSAEDLEKNEKVGIYSIFHPDSNRWLTDNGWENVKMSFDIVPEKTIESNLSVTIAPQEAVESGAKWRIKDAEWQNTDSSVPVSRGNCEVKFKELPGWHTPKSQQIHIFEGDDEKISVEYTLSKQNLLKREPLNMLCLFLIFFIVFVGGYYLISLKSPGTVAISLSPDQALTQGAQWRIKNGDWQASDTSIELSAGEYTIEFKPVDSWQSPANLNISLAAGQTISPHQAYQKILVVNITPEEATKNGAQWKIKGEANWRDNGDDLPLDTKDNSQIVFKAIEGWTAPPEKDISTLENDFMAEYEKEPSAMEAKVDTVDTASTDAAEKTNSTEVANIADKANTTEKVKAKIERSVTVTITPAEVAKAGASWKLEGPGQWKNSGEKISGLINIPYTIIFKSINGWEKPHRITLTDHGPSLIVKQGVYKKVIEQAHVEEK
jgi:hypothetical protein